MSAKHSLKKSNAIRLTLSYLLLAMVAVIIIYPLIWTVGASLNPGSSLLNTSIIPENFSFIHYQELFDGRIDYAAWYWNSMKISFLTMVLTLISVSFTAYAFSRFRFRGRQNGLMLFLLLQMVPQFSAPASCPAKSAFLRLRAIGRMVRSTLLLSISTRPSIRNSCRPSQYLAR